MGWTDHNKLPDIYSSADLLVLPSKFDTFSLVVLEAQSCGLPVVAYNTKGPKDILKGQKSGYLVKTKKEMAQVTKDYFLNGSPEKMKEEALLRASDYRADKILNQLLKDVGFRS